MPSKNLELGRRGEELVVSHLEFQGYRILKRNFKNSLGEIDIIAKDKNTLCFIEVKTRASLDKGLPQEAITARKQRKLSQVALSFLKNNRLLDTRARFDIVSVLSSPTEEKVEIIKDAFPLCERYSY